MGRWVAILVFALGCSSPGRMAGDGGYDAGRDAGDSGLTTADAGQDAGATPDAGHDSGPSCTCSSGPCCDGCNLQGAGFVCGTTLMGTSCRDTGSCGAMTRVYRQWFEDRLCTGASDSCPNGSSVTRNVDTDCQMPAETYLPFGRCSLTGGAHCVDGPSCGSEF
jgi:hypothetical protein